MAYKKILFRRDPAASWTSENPVLSAGEVGLETDTGKIKIGNGSSTWTALSYFVGNLPGATLDSIGDVTITSVQNGDFLRYNGSASVWINDPVNLATDTIGDYVQSLVAGTGVTLSSNSGEGATPTIAIGQEVATSSSVTFAHVLGNVTGNVTGNASTATALQNPRTISLSGDVSGSVSFDGTANASITTTVQPNSIALGADTTGNYMAGVTAGTGVQVSHTPGEGSDATISIGQDVGTGQSVTFAGATIDAIKIGVTNANTIDTTSGNLTIDSSGGTVTIADNLIVDGTLTVSGSVTVVNTQNLQVGDAIITLNHDETGVPSENAGIEVERGTSTNVFLQYNETSDKWELTNDGSSYSPIETTATVSTSLKQQLWLNTVYAATTEVLPNSPSYTAGTTDLNGGTGIGAKLTATTNGLLELDGAPVPLEDRILVKNQANALHNGIYKVTATGSASATWELTRAADFDNSTFGQTIYGKSVRVATGAVNALQVFAVTSVGSVSLNGLEGMIHVIGTDSITWTQVSGKATLIPGNGLEVTGNVLALPSISQSNTASTSGATNFVKSINVDPYGRLLGVTTNDVLLGLGTNTMGDYVQSISASVGTGLTVTGSGEGAVVTVSSNATPNNTNNAIVMRDGSGNFSAGTITAELSGNASTANTLYASKSIGLTGDLSGSVSFNGSQDVVIAATIEPNSVALGTDTTGNYVNDLTAGTGVTVTHTPGEGSSPTVAIGQAVGTSSSVQFAAVTAPLIGNADTATTLATSRTIELTGDVTGSVSFNGSANASITSAIAFQSIVNDDIANGAIGLEKLVVGAEAQILVASGSGNPTYKTLSGDATINKNGVLTISENAVELGTNTTGNYVNDLTAGTGVTITHTPAEGSSPTVAIGQAVATSSSVTFARVETTGNVIVGGNLQVVGTTTTVNETNLSIEDTFIYLNDGSTTTNPDLGWAGNYNDGTYAHAGLFRDATDGKFKFFDSYTLEPTDPINTGHASYSAAPVVAEVFESTIATGTAPLSVSSSTAVTNLNADLLDGQHGSFYAPVNNASFTGTFSAPSGAITSAMIADGTIVNADVSASAAIDLNKIADVSTNAQTASYTLVLADKNKIVEMGVGSANNLTVPLNSSVAFPIGSQINILQTGTGQTTIVATGGVTINATPGLKMRAQWSYATLVKRAENTWVLVGDISA